MFTKAHQVWQCRFGLPQGFLMGPLQWMLYTANLICLFEGYGLLPYMNADVTWIHSSRHPGSTERFHQKLSAYIDDVCIGMCSNHLHLIKSGVPPYADNINCQQLLSKSAPTTTT